MQEQRIGQAPLGLRSSWRRRAIRAAALALLLAACGRLEQDAALVEQDLPALDVSKLEPGVLERYQQFRGALDRAKALPEKTEELATAYGRLGNWLEIHNLDGSLEAYAWATERAPETARWHYHLARLHDRLGRPVEARRAYERVLEREPEHVPTLVAQGNLALLAGRADEARDFFDRAISARPSCAAALLGLGRLDLEAGLLSEAAERLQAAHRLQPQAAPIRYLLARVYMAQGDDRAHAVLQGVPSRKSEQQLVRVEDPWLESMLALRRNSAVDVEAGIRARQRGDLREALRLIERASQSAPANTRPLLEWAVTLLRSGDRTGARAKLEEVLKLSPGHAVAHLQMGLLVADEESLAAIEHLEAAVRSDPGLATAHYALGEQRWRRGEVAAALQRFSRSAQLEPTFAASRHGNAVALAALNRFDEARASLEREGAPGPGAALLEGLLARLVAVAPGLTRSDRARALSRLGSFERETVHSAESRAMILASLGRFGEAVAWQLAALDATRALDGVACHPTVPGMRLRRYELRETPGVAWERRERICVRGIRAPQPTP